MFFSILSRQGWGVNAASFALHVSLFTQAECGVYLQSRYPRTPSHLLPSAQCMYNSDMRLKIVSQAARCSSVVNSSVDAKRNVHFGLSNITSPQAGALSCRHCGDCMNRLREPHNALVCCTQRLRVTVALMSSEQRLSPAAWRAYDDVIVVDFLQY